jgi:8-oxo-dGTP pyrophosphatase MutT (NUDIX family)
VNELLNLVQNLEKRLLLPLPGLESQLLMAGRRRLKYPFRNGVPESAKPSGVLLLLYFRDARISFVLMRRPDYSGVHSGQISLPGGKREPGDRDLCQTALREAKEEVGIDPAQVNVLGTLTPLYIPPSNYIVTPVLGWSSEAPQFNRDPREVEEIIEVGLEDFLDDRSIQSKKIRLFPGVAPSFPCYLINDSVIWGATAMILSEFRAILKELQSSL